MTYTRFFSHMRQLNNELKIIVDDILYQKIKKFIKPFFIFLTGGVGKRKMFTFMCIIQNMLRYYTKQIANVDPYVLLSILILFSAYSLIKYNFIIKNISYN
jgi:hypothetical protein